MAAGRSPGGALTLTVATGFAEVPPAAWDALVPDDDPFLEHTFLQALETSGSVGGAAGWIPCPVLAWRDSALVGGLPLYLKSHSFGEYIFDWGWARGAENAGVPYYPKLVAAVPFTPVTGRRLLVAPGEDPEAVGRALLEGAEAVAERTGAHSLHLLFCRDEELPLLERAGYLPRLSEQYHWHRQPGWEGFEDHLGAMRAPARKQIRRERRQAASHGLTLSLRAGPDFGDREWAAVDRLYRDTVRRHGGLAYLTPAFFETLRARHAHRVRAAFAHQGLRPVAMALFFLRGTGLFGRYWGSESDWDGLHFELCYHLPIEWGLAHGITRFEAGAQGDHKLKRGLLPAACHSAHRLRHPDLHAAVAAFVEAEAHHLEGHLRRRLAESPLRRDERDLAPGPGRLQLERDP